MKKTLSLILAALLAASVLASCALNGENEYSQSSSEYEDAYALLDRLSGGEAKGDFVLACGEEATSLSADLSSFTDEGYVIRRIGDETAILGKTEDGLDRGVRYYVNHFAGSGEDYYASGEGYKVKALSVAGRDISEYSIRISADADECHRFAASELREYIGRACGIYPEIVTEDAAHMIVLEQVMPEDERYSVLGDEGYCVSVKESGDLYITGGQYRGCMYGVYGFLEEYVGWRFMYDYDLTVAYRSDRKPLPYYSSYDDAVIDYLYEAESIDIPAGTEYTQVPDFEYRDLYDDPGFSNLSPEKYAVKIGANGEAIRNKPEFNGYNIGTKTCHGIIAVSYMFVDYEPGKGTQNCCYSNEDNIQIAIEYYEGQLNARLAAGQQIGREIIDIDVGHDDTGAFCTCKNCSKLYSQDGFSTGAVLYFTNRVAAAVAEDISPDIYVNMFGYWGTCNPPKKTVPLDNVSVSYCYYNDIEKIICYRHGMSGEDCNPEVCFGMKTANSAYAEELKGWLELCDRVIVWYYPGTWAASPLSNALVFNVLEDMKFMRDCGIYGIFTCPAYRTATDGILAYAVGRLMWDCDLTDAEYEAMLREYCDIMYGGGADNIYEYLCILNRQTYDRCWNTNGFCDPATRIKFSYFRDNFGELIGLYDEAASLADSADQEYRIIYHSLSMYYTGLIATYSSEFTNGSEAQRQQYLERWNYFCDYAQKMKLRWYRDIEDLDRPFDGFDIETTNPGTLADMNGKYPLWWDAFS